MWFNEIDGYCADWLQNLWPSATVDRRSIVDLAPSDIRADRAHFFAGIGGWEYALSLAGWPADRPVWTGSCPCQPFSAAGKRKAHADERHLWPEFRRLIAECRPPAVFGEQVASRLGREWLAGVRADLEALGYAVGAADLCAAGVAAPHLRQRLYWVAHAPDANQGSGERPAEAGAWPDRERGRRPASRSATGGLAHPAADGLQGRGCSASGEPHREPAQRGRSADDGDARRVADPDGGKPRHGELQRGGEHRQRAEDSDAGWLADALLAGWAEGRTGPRYGSPPWCRIALRCTDDKWRGIPANEAGDIEPRLFPLAHGVPARMGKLRAYGNAIVPQAAAAFVRAFLEAESGVTP